MAHVRYAKASRMTYTVVQEQIRMARDMQERMQAEGAAPPEPAWWQKMLEG